MLLAVAAAPALRADVWDKKTTVTFSQSVEIPSAVLPAGTYIFKLVDSPSDRHIVRVMNERENHVFATILAIPAYRMDPPEKTILTFYEMPVGQPEAVKEWFYPGDNYGQEFIYSKKRAAEIALLVKQKGEVVASAAAPIAAPAPVTEDKPVISETTPAAAEPAPPAPPAPSEEAMETPNETATPEPAAEPEPGGQASSTPSDGSSADMPKTASQFALIGLLGVFAAGLAAGVRRYRRALRP